MEGRRRGSSGGDFLTAGLPVARWRRLPRVSGRTAALLLLAFVAVSAAFFTTGPASDVRALAGGTLVDETPGYTADWLHAQLGGYGPAGRALYARFLLMDAAYAALFSVAVSSAIAAAVRPASSAMTRLAAALPVLAGGCDWLENAGLLVLLARYPQQVPVLAASLGVITPVKLALVQLSFLVLAVAVAVSTAAAIRRARSR
jgi:hypothetical protein